MSPQRLLFAGTPEFAVPALSALIGAGWEIAAVYTQPDRPAGRGRKTLAPPVKELAAAAGLEVRQPANLKDPGVVAQMRAFDAEAMVVAAYGLLLPPQVLAAPRLGCINIHASLLPRWRGAAPIQRAIAAGDERTGVSIMRMEKGLDTGPVYAVRDARIGRRETAGALHDRLAALGARLLVDVLPELLAEAIVPAPQDEAAATHAAKLSKAEARLDWRQPAVVLDRLVRAFDPWPIAETLLDGKTLRIWQAEALTPGAPAAGGRPHPPGLVLHSGSHGIDVATGDGILRLIRVQTPGRQPIAAADLANARRLDGAVLG